MPLFTYIALDPSGSQKTGQLDAPTRAEALRDLESRALQVASIAETSKNKKATSTTGKDTSDDTTPLKLKNIELISFTEELSELLNAGLPLEPALASMEAHDDHGPLQQTAARLRRWITEGLPLYQALPKVSPQFDALYCNLVRAGEASGSLNSILNLHSSYLKEQAELRSRLAQALIYPAFLIFFCLIATLVFIFYLIPKITTLLDGMQASEMPLGIKAATAISHGVTHYWPHGLILLGILIIGTKLWFQSEKNQHLWDRWKLRLPLYGRVLQYGFYVQWLQTIGNLMANGVPLVKALELTTQTVQNRHYREELQLITDQVGDGYKLTNSMRRTGIFTPNLIDLVGVGESTGKLARAFQRATDYFDKRLSTMLKSILGIISPIILASMAVLVALLCYTMIQAIYQTIEQIQQR